MAGLIGSVSLAATPLVANTAKTVLRVKAPANQRVKILAFGLFFDGVDGAGIPVQIQMGRISVDGTFTPGVILPIEEELAEVFQTSVGTNASAEPTYSGQLATLAVHPQFGYEKLIPLGQEVVVRGGGLFGWVVNAPAAVNVRGYVEFEE